MDVLLFNELETSGLKRQVDKVVSHLAAGNFRAADSRKLKGFPFYRARLDDANRLLFQIGNHGGRKALLILEVIRNHDYEKSRFLRGGTWTDADFSEIVDEKSQPDTVEMKYINEKYPRFHVLDRVLSLDDAQVEALSLPPPLILIGSAGSGKTVLTLKKLKGLAGRVLYLSHSPFLVENSRSLYYSNGFSSETQEVDFLAFREYLETLSVPEGREVQFRDFAAWLQRMRSNVKDARKLFEECRGIITGFDPAKEMIAHDEYLSLGVKQSILLENERADAYGLFERFVAHMREQKLYDSSMLASRYLSMVKPEYDWVLVDEVQDFTTAQLAVVLKALRDPRNFVLSGDSNQIVHPNFFSWARVKSFFFEQTAASPVEIIRVLHANYRNGRRVTEVSNRLLKVKQRRFGSIDRESNYLISNQCEAEGAIDVVEDTQAHRKDLNERTRRSARTAILVLSDEAKAEAQRVFETPLLFSVHEAKGLEYENVVMFNLVSDAEAQYRFIAEGVSDADLEGDLTYARGRDKSDKSGEAYKFYVNALYVALTRAMRTVVMVERRPQQPLLKLLGVVQGSKKVELKSAESNADEWRREARKLELQGRQEQAERIRSEILKLQPVPWPVLDVAGFLALLPKALDTRTLDKKAQKQAFDFALAHDFRHVMPDLARAKLTFAQDPDAGLEPLKRRLLADYLSTSTDPVMALVRRHGIEHLNPLGETPLMCAARAGNAALAQRLRDEGGDTMKAGPSGLNAFGLALREALRSPEFCRKSLSAVEAMLGPRRFALVVSDEAFDSAVRELDQMRRREGIFDVSVLDLARVRERRRAPGPDSLATKVRALDSRVGPYVDFVLGDIVCVGDVLRLREFPRAVTPEVMVHSEFAVRAIPPQRFRPWHVGSQALESQLQSLREELDAEGAEFTSLARSLSEVENRMKILARVLALEPRWEKHVAGRFTADHDARLRATQAELGCLDLSSLQAMTDALADLKGRLTVAALAERRSLEERADLRVRCETLERELPELETRAALILQQVTETEQRHPDLCKKALDAVAEKRAQAPLGEVARNAESTALPEFQSAIEEETRKAEHELREHILHRLREQIGGARQQLERLNDSLKKLTFHGESYRFRWYASEELHEFYQLITEARGLGTQSLLESDFYKNNRAQFERFYESLTSSPQTEVERRLQERLTDYRSYLSYDIEVTHADGQVSRLSRILGQTSGGETQTPFYVTIAGSFLQLYSSRERLGYACPRLVVFDEAFSKMDQDRIGATLQLFHYFGLQVVTATPLERCEYLVPHMKTSLVLTGIADGVHIEPYRNYMASIAQGFQEILDGVTKGAGE